MNTTNYVLYAVLPYLAVFIAVGGTIWRFNRDPFSFSSLSSQFLEYRRLFWGSIPWHFGIIIILLTHLIAFLIPGPWRRLLSNIDILTALEIIGLALAVAALTGLFALAWRRLSNARIRVTSSTMDWVLFVVLIAQVGSGFVVALAYRWGADWYMDTSVPWIVSLLKFQPRIEYVTDLPLFVRFHLLLGFGVIGVFPFTRLVHIISFPFRYLSRPLQVVIWNQKRKFSKPE
ncbi:MAG: respiratory nitrate reductase subunit gamma [Gammaproteobacteria bacterium]